MKRSLVVDVSGKPGVAGHHGKSGSDGRSGHNGSSGGTGGDGTRGDSGGDGTNGGHGDEGTNGQNAENIIVTIEGLDHKSITVTGSANDSLCLDDGSVRTLVFLANGGDGGDGGDGGRGGDGGHGGDGGDGGCGRNGADGFGGDGGDGGKGGNGGDGGNGANGGNGGNGGKIIIETHNPSLLKFVQSECLGGKKGNGGQCGSAGKLGKGGCEGKGGRGGSGGSPPYNDGEYSGSYGASGSSGNDGYPGKNGTPGKTGTSGEDGNYGVDGSVEYVVYDPATNQVVDRGSSVFDLVVDSFQLTAVEDDGIFEPGEDVYVSNVTITNRGGLTLPVGSVISFPTTSGEHTFLSSGSCYVLQQPLSPGERFIIPFQFNGCILDIPEVNPSILGDFQATLPIQSLATLLTSPFKTSLKNEYNIEYPVKIESIKIPPNLGRDETGIVTITFENISQINYGCDEKTRLKYSLVFDPKILVHNEPNLNGSNRIEEELPMIPPGSTFSRIFQIEISELQYFEIVPIKASLFLRGKRIENAESEIKLIPKFTPIANRTENPFDILFFTNGHIQKDEFSCYLKIFNGLDLKVNVWDIERYNGASYLKETGERHPDSWINGGFEGKMIILPMNDNTDDQLLDTSDIFRLLRGTNWRMDKNHPTNGSILFIGTTVASNFRKRLSKNVSETQIPKTELKEMLIIKSPKKEHLEKKVDKYIRNLLKNSKNRIIEPSDFVFFPLEGKGFSTTLGSAYYKELPLTVSDNLFFVSPNKNSPLSFLSEDKQDNLNCNQFKVNSNFGRLFYSVILALPLEKKLKLLRKPTDWLKKITFKEGNGVIVSYVNSIVLSLNYYIFLEFIYKEEIGRYTNIILKDFESNFQDYFNSPNCKLIVASLYHVIAKLRKDLKWKGMLLSKSKGNKEAFSKFCKSFQKILFSLLDSSTVDYIKKETKEMIENCKVKQFIVEKLDFVQRPLIDGYHQKFESDISKDVFDTFKKETHLK